jgi:hypothetical protein
MRLMTLVLSFGLSALCVSASGRDIPYCIVLRQVAEAATPQSEARPLALQVLEAVALGRADDIAADVESRLGLPRNQLHGPGSFTGLGVRECALRQIGRTALPEAVEFLSGLKASDFADDTSQTLWGAVNIALQEAALRGIHDSYLQTKFLEEATLGRGGMWAVDELCDRGSFPSLVTIQNAIRRIYRGDDRAEGYIAFCEARITALYGKPDRAKALGALLNAETDRANRQLLIWAVGQLAKMHTAEADAELNRFLNDIRKLPPRSDGRERLQWYERLVPEIQAAQLAE